MGNFTLKNTLNTRDLGGYLLEEGDVTLENSFIRSDAPLNLSNEDINLLIENNIKTIIDLRSEEEARKKPYAIMNNKDFNYYHCPMFGGAEVPKSEELVPKSYFEMVDEQKSIYKVMKVLAKTQDGALYHCAVGKDRTGVISALLLLLANVKREEIITDYTTSWDKLKKELIEYCQVNKNIDLGIVTPKREYMELFLDLFHEKYNSIEEYLIKIGLEENEIIALKRKLRK
ncbi:tyrosine-protein phosphatase [Clostridium sp. C8-1-8]|uniref:tyrosine-protein phosphatase n=1 Tax=Clostridium sp. C8-1-8 TaxID=2698831 RepID=UPI00136D2802|nr:tyrosine-protein phosphatase [Clostridium sp. C8-1-8]